MSLVANTSKGKALKNASRKYNDVADQQRPLSPPRPLRGEIMENVLCTSALVTATMVKKMDTIKSAIRKPASYKLNPVNLSRPIPESHSSHSHGDEMFKQSGRKLHYFECNKLNEAFLGTLIS